MAKAIIGIDIRADKLSAVLLKSSIKGTWIEAHTHQRLNGEADPDTTLTQAIEKVKERFDRKDATCIVALPPHLISYRNIQVPFKENKKIIQMLPYELETALPMPIDEVMIDFQVVDVTDTAHLMTASMEKHLLQSFLDTLQSQRLAPNALTAGVFSTALCLSHLIDLPQSWILLDLEKNYHTLLVVVAGQIFLIRAFPTPSKSTLKTKWLTNNIRRTLYACEDLFSLDFQPACVILTGSKSLDTSLNQEISQQLNLPVQTYDLAQELNINLRSSPEKWQPSQMDAALALTALELNGIEGLNFRQGTLAAERPWREHKKSLTVTGILALLLFILVTAAWVFENHRMQSRIRQLDTAIASVFKAAFPDIKRIVDPLQQMRVKMDALKKEPSMQLNMAAKTKRIDILNKISQSIPAKIDTKLSRLVIAGDSVLISGTTATFNAVDEMKNRLDRIDFFKNVTISSANMDKTGNRVRFKLKMSL
jgi:type II secretion system protein L